jgi:hypothetical protein
MLKKLLGWALVAFLVFYVISNPSGAATTAHSLAAGLAHVGTSVGDFFAALTGGGR